MTWTQPCTSSGKCVSIFAMEPVGKMMQSNSLAELHILPVLVVKILNKGGTKRQVAWRWLELNHAPVQKSVFQLLHNGSCSNFANDAEQCCVGAAFVTCFWLWTVWIKVLPKGKLLEDDLKSTLYHFKKVYFNSCSGSCCNFEKWCRATFVLEQALYLFWWWKFRIKVLPKDKLPDDDSS